MYRERDGKRFLIFIRRGAPLNTCVSTRRRPPPFLNFAHGVFALSALHPYCRKEERKNDIRPFSAAGNNGFRVPALVFPRLAEAARGDMW